MTESTSLRRTVAVTLAAASLVAVTTLTGGVAQARESSADQGPLLPGTLLFLSVTKGSQTIGTAVLTCDPPGGSHPYPRAACNDLSASFGDFTDLPGVPGQACDDMYDPVQATAFGWWRGPLKFFSNTYGNICDLYRRTAWVFPLPDTFPPPPSPPPSTTSSLPRPTTSSPMPTVTFTIPRPTTSSPMPTVTFTIPRPSTTKPTPTVPTPTVTLDPPETAVPHDR